MNIYSCEVKVFNGRYAQQYSRRVRASTWTAAAGTAIRQITAERKKQGLSGRRLERVDVVMIRIPARRQ